LVGEKAVELLEELNQAVSQLWLGLGEESDQFAQVLDRGNQQILDSLFPKSSPASAFQPMTVSGIGKAAFHQVLSSFKVAFGGFGMGDLARSIQKCLILVTMERTAFGRSGTKLAQRTL
jgi:hypothetical protein